MVDMVRRFIYQRSPRRRLCQHLDQIRFVDRVGSNCAECANDGKDPAHVRMCLVCGHLGCSDSSEPQHARKHYEETGHPLIRSVEPGERWAWCYEDEAFLTGPEYLA